MDIGFYIKQYRQSNNLTLREFAARCGTSHSYIAMLENGKNSKTGEPIVPSIAMLKKIANATRVSVNDLIVICDDTPITLGDDLGIYAESKSPSALTEGEEILLELFRQIPAEQQKVFLEMGRVYANSLKKG